MREEPSYKETKSKEVGRVADDAVVLMMFCESGAEGRASVEFKCSKNGRSVYYPIGVTRHALHPGSLASAVLLVRRDQDSRKPYEGKPHVRFDEGKRRNRQFTALLFLLYNSDQSDGLRVQCDNVVTVETVFVKQGEYLIRKLTKISFFALALLAIPGCSLADKSGASAIEKNVYTMAARKFGNNYALVPNSTGLFILCISQDKALPGVPVQPGRFFVYDVRRDSIVYEHELENGTVLWRNATQLLMTWVPGNITGDETPDAYTEVYDLASGKTSKR